MRYLGVLVVVVMLVPTVAGLHESPSAEDEVEVLVDDEADVTWQAVAFSPDGDHALLVGGYEAEDEPRGLVARWEPGGQPEVVYNRSGSTLVDVDVREDGTSLVVGARDTILLGRPGSFENVWETSRFGGEDQQHTFFGSSAAWSPEGDFGLVAGSSLLRVEENGSLEVLHGGEDAFFGTARFNPLGGYALVETALQQDDGKFLGAVWRTDGVHSLSSSDNVAVYGRFARGHAWLNAIAFSPNGTFATLAGNDGTGASFLTWAASRECPSGESGSCPGASFAYTPATMPRGAVTCIDWHPQAPYALVTGTRGDVVGYAGTHAWAPVWHEGPDLLGCAFAPDGETALAVGGNGTLVRVRPGPGPLVGVLDPQPGRLATPAGEQPFLVGVVDRGQGTVNVSARVPGEEANVTLEEQGAFRVASVNTSTLSEGEHDLVVNASSTSTNASVRFPFLVNNEAFSPPTPTMLEPTGLEGENLTSDGMFEVRWAPLDEPVVYQLEMRSHVGNSTSVDVLDVGRATERSVHVGEEGTYSFRVRAENSFAAGNWSQPVSVVAALEGERDRNPLGPYPEDAWQGPQQADLGALVEERCVGSKAPTGACREALERLGALIEEHQGRVASGMELVYAPEQAGGVVEAARGLEAVREWLNGTAGLLEQDPLVAELGELQEAYRGVVEAHGRGLAEVQTCWRSNQPSLCQAGLARLESATQSLNRIEEQRQDGLEAVEEAQADAGSGDERWIPASGPVSVLLGGTVAGLLAARSRRRGGVDP